MFNKQGVIDLLIAAVIFGGILLISEVTHSAEPTSRIVCTMDKTAMGKTLEQKWREGLLLVGVFSGGKHLMQFFANKQTGTWSIVRVDQAGEHCLISSGDGLTPYRGEEGPHAQAY